MPVNPSSKHNKVRLNKLIADSGLCSRRQADTLIEEGLVRVNDKKVTTLGQQVNPETDRVTVQGKPLPRSRKQYLLFHKPTGCLTTRSDERGRQTIYDILDERYQALDPAGRLDRNTSGVLILSNDGDFLHRITHPSFHVKKTYRVTLNRPLLEEDAARLIEGVLLEPENKLAQVQSLAACPNNTYELVLATGYNRQIRRTMEVLGYEITRLKRTRFGPIALGSLKPGQTRPLTPAERQALKPAKQRAAGKPASKRTAAAPKQGQKGPQNKNRPVNHQHKDER